MGIFGSSKKISLFYIEVCNCSCIIGFYLTALELHAELAECGRSLPLLHQFFSTPSNLVGGMAEEAASPSFRRDTPVRSLPPSAASFPNDIREAVAPTSTAQGFGAGAGIFGWSRSPKTGRLRNPGTSYGISFEFFLFFKSALY